MRTPRGQHRFHDWRIQRDKELKRMKDKTEMLTPFAITGRKRETGEEKCPLRASLSRRKLWSFVIKDMFIVHRGVIYER